MIYEKKVCVCVYVSSVGFGSVVMGESSKSDAGLNRLPSGSSEPAFHWSDSALGNVLPVLGLEHLQRLGAAWSRSSRFGACGSHDEAYTTRSSLLSPEAGIAQERCLGFQIVDIRMFLSDCQEKLNHMPYGMIVFGYCTWSARAI